MANFRTWPARRRPLVPKRRMADLDELGGGGRTLAATIVDRVAPLPLAAIHSTHDEFEPVAEVERILMSAREPKRLWIGNASNHRFSDNVDEFDRQLLEAIAWVKVHAPS